MQEKIIVSVISDLVTDQRVQKECMTLHHQGYDILLIGRASKRKFILEDLPYKTIRFYNPFSRGPLMYLVFNAQLFFYLLFKKANILWSNDLDTLLPNFLIWRLKKNKLIYDSHEYFTESVIKKSSRKIWQRLEQRLFPHLKNVLTVNQSIRKIYEEKYGVPITVLRNVPSVFSRDKNFQQMDFSFEKKILIIQGMGINENRGAEEAVLMMQFLPEKFMLYFIGSGTILPKLKAMANELKLNDRVIFIGVLPYREMMEYTRKCWLGLIFEKIDVSDEHLYALPNKFFDYVQGGIPVLSSKGVEIKSVVDKYQIGDFIDNFIPQEIAEKIIEIDRTPEIYNFWKKNTLQAAAELNWDIEEKILIDFMKHLS